MASSPIFVRKATKVITALSTNLLEMSSAACRIRVGSSKYRYDPYNLTVLENREYPTPAFQPMDLSQYKAAMMTPVKLAPAPAKRSVCKLPPPPVIASKPVPAAASMMALAAPIVAAPIVATAAPAPAPAVAPVPAGPSGQPVCRVLVEFKRGDDVYLSHIHHKVGDYVLVLGDRGEDMGVVTSVLPVRGPSVANVTGVASEQQKSTLLSLRRDEPSAVRLCQQRVDELGLPMCIEDVEFQYDGNKATIYYSSNRSVDFRQLQRQLFRDFRCRVWLRTVPAGSGSGYKC